MTKLHSFRLYILCVEFFCFVLFLIQPVEQAYLTASVTKILHLSSHCENWICFPPEDP